ncbi:glycoside hydrolase family 104 protein [Acinetobacter sp. NIPH1876]|uniref:glycoside hydrolase family 24 protein n=1 Tax=unclassified Acinetobacter TaxID=196816 RepID=UPI001FAD3BCB|nr:glycoside hydrolase family 104 protein [Acinetobacter sp. NIPH1876]MCJ0827921.1 glycoside hydrolase family 104 protein [Acinetobacter sp. NIPH1876]
MANLAQLQQAYNNPNVRRLLDVIASAEGVKHGYNTMFGNQRFGDLSAHPNIRKSFRQTDGQTNYTTAAGRYQFIKGTWDGLARQYGFRDFSPQSQDLGAIALIAQRGALQDAINGNYQKAISKLGGTWASLPSSPYAQPRRSQDWINKQLGVNGDARPVDFRIPVQRWSDLTRQQDNAASNRVPTRNWADLTGNKNGNTTPKSGSAAMFFGDSIANGYRQQNKSAGETLDGASPIAVLNQIQKALKQNPNALRGQNIVLSSGYSNNVNDTRSIEQQLSLLKNAGANVQLMGVANQYNKFNQNGAAMNSNLQNLAGKYGASFLGGFDAGSDLVHPKSYRDNYVGKFSSIGAPMLTQDNRPQALNWAELTGQKSNPVVDSRLPTKSWAELTGGKNGG